MTTWRNQYVHVNKYSRPGMKLNGVRKLIVHYTANPGATAANHFGYFDKSIIEAKRYASAHIFVDKTEAICIVPLNEVAYAANDVQQRINGNPYRGVPELLPDANFLSISVEICIEKDGSFHADTIARSVEVFAELCATYKLDPMRDIVRHYDVTHKNCPAPWVTNGSAFTTFKNRVKEKMAMAAIPADSADGKLTRGERGPNVKQLNLWLHELTYTFKTDDLFDQYTEAALKAFQKDHGLPQDAVYTSKIGDVMVKAIADKKAKSAGTIALDSVPVKNADKYRLAKFIDTSDLALIDQLRKDGYKVIELPKEAK